MKRIIFDVLRVFCRYAVIVIGGTCLFLIVVQLVGYLPCSDRPGPGWYGLFPKITLADCWTCCPLSLGGGCWS
jgi:hypothetical protein